MKVLIDTNVILDIILKREPYFKDAERLTVLVEKGHMIGYITAAAVTDIFYIASKKLQSKKDALEVMRKLFQTIRIAPVNEDNIHEALNLSWGDFEDAVEYSCGKSMFADYIITRDLEGFKMSSIKTLSPKDLLAKTITYE
ncbi:MAG: PIN domain-containing protein [Clostridiales bacterium]|jgi:predicted nucleic acid-binding protein|nr:PIN domain-containing protein [Clostridiales bacterium]